MPSSHGWRETIGVPTDFEGTHFEPDANARIVSLVPSLTELVFDLGLGTHLVGRTHYCVHPADKLTAVPSLGGTKKIKMDRLAEVGATHVLVNVDENPKELAAEIAATGVQVVVTHPNAPEDNPALYRLIGQLFGAEAAAEEMCKQFDEAFADLKAATCNVPTKRVLYLIWKDPWMTISQDTYIANTLQLINWQTVGSDPDNRYPEVDLESVLTDTDLVLFSSEPYAFAQSDLAEFSSAFPNTPAQLIDGEMTSWYGSRAIEGLRYLKNITGNQ
jgi:ABC-type Fe3+-hydroxamate transport system substrate-binding protein